MGYVKSLVFPVNSEMILYKYLPRYVIRLTSMLIQFVIMLIKEIADKV